MNVIGVSGSPNLEGFINMLFNRAIEGAKSEGANTEMVILNELEFKPCQECHGCGESGECVLKDELSPIYKKLLDADGLIVASPIYYGTISAQLKMMIDRLECLWKATTRSNQVRRSESTQVSNLVRVGGLVRGRERKGIFICVAGEDRADYFENAKKIVRIMFSSINVKYSGELFFGGLNSALSDDSKKSLCARQAFSLGARLNRL